MSIDFVLTARCGLCGYVCKGMKFASGCHVNKGSIATTRSLVVAPFCRECNFPRMDSRVRMDLTPDSEARVNAARAKRGWPALDAAA
jgi:hypothetical protein